MIKIFGFVVMRQDEYDAALINVLQEGVEYGRRKALNTGKRK